jgi:hypothetical protein
LAALEQAGVSPTAVWLRFLTGEGIRVADDTALALVAERYGASARPTVEAWHGEISTAIDGAASYHDATRIAIQEGPRVALLLIPDGAFEQALRLFDAA